MIYIIGIGLKPKHLTIEAVEAIKECNSVFLEAYTSSYGEGTVKELERTIGKGVMKLKREQVEENSRTLLMQGKKEDICLLVYGNPFTATTHIQLLLDAKKLGVKCRVLPGISVVNFLGKTGLDEYRFGRVATIVFPTEKYAPESFYDIIEKNKKSGLHTLCLLDIKAEEGKMMAVSEALNILEKIEKKRGKSIVKESKVVALCGVGGSEEIIKSASFNELKRSRFNSFPQSLVVCGELNEKEKEALEVLSECPAIQ